MKILIKYLCLFTIAVAGVDRINMLSSDFELFTFTPFLLCSLLTILIIFIFKFDKINLSWIYHDKIAYQFFLLFIVSVLISILFSQDFLISFKRSVLLFTIISVFILIISIYNNKELNEEVTNYIIIDISSIINGCSRVISNSIIPHNAPLS